MHFFLHLLHVITQLTRLLLLKNPGMFSSKTLIYFRLKKERRGHLG